MSVAVSCGWVVGGGSLDLITYKLGVDSDVVAGTNKTNLSVLFASNVEHSCRQFARRSMHTS